jgi:hypothetical protein
MEALLSPVVTVTMGIAVLSGHSKEQQMFGFSRVKKFQEQVLQEMHNGRAHLLP